LRISQKMEPAYLEDLYAGVSKGLSVFDKNERNAFIVNYIDGRYRHFIKQESHNP